MALAMRVVDAAKALVGCTLEHEDAVGVIVETEAYHEVEPAAHSHIGMTPRSRVLFEAPGRLYVYRSYGIHALANVVVEPEGVGAAVLIRALEPIEGLGTMAMRRGRTRPVDLCSGPGKLTQALGIELIHNDTSVRDGPVRDRPAAARLGAAAARRRAADRHHEGGGPAVAVLRRGQHPRVPAVAAGDAPSAARASRQPRLVGEHDGLRAVAQPELREHPRDVRLHRRPRRRALRDLRVREAARDEAEHLGSRGVRSSSASVARVAPRRRDELVEQPPRDGRRDQRVARRDDADAVHELLGPDVLQQESARPGARARRRRTRRGRRS